MIDELESDGTLLSRDSPRPLRYHSICGRDFPIGICGCCPCCPEHVVEVIPSAWKVIQDWTHLILLVGQFLTVLLIVTRIISVCRFNCFVSSYGYCLPDVIAIIYVGPLFPYFTYQISEYDDRLRNKREQIANETQKIKESRQQLLNDMGGFVESSVESNVRLAENNFEDKRKDFLSFIRHAKAKYKDLDNSNPATTALFECMQHFIIQWLLVFEECSIDPVHYPNRIAESDKLRAAQTISDLLDLIDVSLGACDTRFITGQQTRDKQKLNALCIESSPSVCNEQRNGKRCGCSRTRPGEGGFPVVCRIGFCEIKILSGEHLTLLLAFLMSLCLIVVGICRMVDTYTCKAPRICMGRFSFGELCDVLLIMTIAACLVSILIRFQDIDSLYHHKREQQIAEQEKHKVERQAARMRTFGEKLQQLTDLWLERTLPTLELLRNVSYELLDTVSDDQDAQLLNSCSIAFARLKEALGPLEDWYHDGLLDRDRKEEVGKMLRGLSKHKERSTKVISNLNAAINDGSLVCTRTSVDVQQGDLFSFLSSSGGGARTLHLTDSATAADVQQGHLSSFLSTESEEIQIQPTLLRSVTTFFQREDDDRQMCEDFLGTNRFSGINARKSVAMLGCIKTRCCAWGMPLHAAVQQGELRILHCLLQQRADPTLTNSRGMTPLQVAVQLDRDGSHLPIIEALNISELAFQTRNIDDVV